MPDDWAARDAYANYHEALRVMREALLRSRAAHASGADWISSQPAVVVLSAPDAGGWGRVQPPPIEGGDDATTA